MIDDELELEGEEGQDEGDAEEAPPAEVDLDAPSDSISPEQAAALFGRRKPPPAKPDISALPDALGADGRPLFKEGDKIVIERYSACLSGRPYLNTRTYRVVSIDPSTGNLALYDDSLAQHAGDNYRTGPACGNVYKFAMGTSVGKRKRGRPRKNPVPPPAAPAALGPDGLPVKKRRGRPPGSRNKASPGA